MIVNRVERHVIKKSNPMWKLVDYYCYKAKNVYNLANYIVRQEFTENNNWIRNNKLDKMIQKEECYKNLGSQASQNTLTLLDKNWNSFFRAIKDWSKKDGNLKLYKLLDE